MLAFGLSDPYSRFITPEEFQVMRKYDVTGVGLNLATAEEFVRKSGLPLPPHSAGAEVRAPSPALCHGCSCMRMHGSAAAGVRRLAPGSVSSLAPTPGQLPWLLQCAAGHHHCDQSPRIWPGGVSAALHGDWQ